jgi:hypothetical protein
LFAEGSATLPGNILTGSTNKRSYIAWTLGGIGHSSGDVARDEVEAIALLRWNGKARTVVIVELDALERR